MEDKKKDILSNRKLKQNPFTVPDNYFEAFAHKIDKEIAKKEVKRKPRRILWLSAAAACLILFLFQGFAYMVNQERLKEYEQNYETYLLSQLDNASIIFFIEGEDEFN